MSSYPNFGGLKTILEDLRTRLSQKLGKTEKAASSADSDKLGGKLPSEYQTTLVSGVAVKTLNDIDVLGSGNIATRTVNGTQVIGSSGNIAVATTAQGTKADTAVQSEPYTGVGTITINI